MDLTEFLERFGLPTLIVVAVLVFVWKLAWPFVTDKIWPFVTAAWEDMQAERRDDQRRFLQSLVEQRMTFERVANEERRMRLEERDKFLGALDTLNKNMADVARVLEDFKS